MPFSVITPTPAVERRDHRHDPAAQRRRASAATGARDPLAHERERTLVRASLLLVGGPDKPTHRRWA